jgi:hypothetical protein
MGDDAGLLTPDLEKERRKQRQDQHNPSDDASAASKETVRERNRAQVNADLRNDPDGVMAPTFDDQRHPHHRHHHHRHKTDEDRLNEANIPTLTRLARELEQKVGEGTMEPTDARLAYVNAFENLYGREQLNEAAQRVFRAHLDEPQLVVMGGKRFYQLAKSRQMAPNVAAQHFHLWVTKNFLDDDRSNGLIADWMHAIRRIESDEPAPAHPHHQPAEKKPER